MTSTQGPECAAMLPGSRMNDGSAVQCVFAVDGVNGSPKAAVACDQAGRRRGLTAAVFTSEGVVEAA